MAINRLYDTWFRTVRQLWPEVRRTLGRNLAWFVSGMYQSRSVQLQRIAMKIPSAATLPSVTRQQSRLLANPQVRVRPWYRPTAQAVVQEMARSVGEIRLIVDATKVSAQHQLVMVALAYRRRAIPLAWTWVRHAKGHTSAYRQRALLAYVYRLIPLGVPVVVVGDSGFGAVEVLRQLEAWHWYYALRQTAKELVRFPRQVTWHAFGSLVEHPGQSVWRKGVTFTARRTHRTNVWADWASGEKEPWLLTTNLPTAARTCQAYGRRMWIDEMFGDLKKHGVDLESTHLTQIARLSRLTLLVALLYLWLISVGSHLIKRGQRSWVDRHDRRDLSIFQIGWRLIERFLNNALPLPRVLRPYFR